MDLTIVTISTNEAEYLKVGFAALPAVFGSLEVEVFLIDNACSDGSAEIARALIPNVRIIRNETRRGFSTNNNLAIRAESQPRQEHPRLESRHSSSARSTSAMVVYPR